MRRIKLIIYSVMAILFGIVLLFDQEFSNGLFIVGSTAGLLTISIGLLTLMLMILKNKKVDRNLYMIHCGVLGGLTAVSILRMYEGVTNVIWIFTGGILVLTLLMLVRDVNE
ncbi:hypothetical protein [Enterococcus larvae]|uniref:hypothetical protein n=1 Tax=Enterococcus larvae TaxID=2794352 RepID=UPI003F340222